MQSITTKENLIPEIFIPKELINFSDRKAKIFALDSQSIGISNNPPDHWLSDSLWNGDANLTEENDGYTLLLPQELIGFYLPKEIEISVETKREI